MYSRRVAPSESCGPVLNGIVLRRSGARTPHRDRQGVGCGVPSSRRFSLRDDGPVTRRREGPTRSEFSTASACCRARSSSRQTLRLGKDVISGRGGRDCLRGGKGRDRISGGPGKDKLNGGAGNDKINGGRGRDSVSGKSGRDTIKVVDGKRDRVNCGKGNDIVRADKKDRLRGCERVTRVQ